MATVSFLPGDLAIQLTVGDEVSFTIDLDVDVTGYTFTAGVYIVSSAGFPGGGGGFVTAVGASVGTPTITVVNAAAGTLSWGMNETQTAALSSGISYRHFVRYVTPAGITRTVISGDLVARAP
jgi:hypothetical protein